MLTFTRQVLTDIRVGQLRPAADEGAGDDRGSRIGALVECESKNDRWPQDVRQQACASFAENRRVEWRLQIGAVKRLAPAPRLAFNRAAAIHEEPNIVNRVMNQVACS